MEATLLPFTYSSSDITYAIGGMLSVHHKPCQVYGTIPADSFFVFTVKCRRSYRENNYRTDLIILSATSTLSSPTGQHVVQQQLSRLPHYTSPPPPTFQERDRARATKPSNAAASLLSRLRRTPSQEQAARRELAREAEAGDRVALKSIESLSDFTNSEATLF